MKRKHLFFPGKVIGAFILIKKNIFLLAIIVFAFITNLGITVFNGAYVCWKGECGLYIGNLHYHDFLWHFALSVNSFKTYPFSLPIFSGASLGGYNFLIDFILFILLKIGIPVMTSYFILLPLLYVSLMAYLGYVYLKNKNKDPLYIASGLFFIFFGSSFSYILSLYHFGSWRSFMYAQAMQSGRALLNLQYALSLPLILGSLIILEKEKLGIKRVLVLSLFLFLVFGLKFYGGVVLLTVILVNRAIAWMKKKEAIALWEFIAYGTGCYIAYSIFYKVPGAQGAFPFVFSPFAIAHPLIEEKDMFYMPSLVLARYTLAGMNKFSPRLMAIEFFTAGVFLFYNLGSRAVGFAAIAAHFAKKKISRSNAAVLFAILISLMITLLFIQKREWWNIIQFFGYSLFLMNFFAAEALYSLLKSKRKLFFAFGVVVILLTLPTNIEQITFAGERYISIRKGEQVALEFLKKQPVGIVLVLPVQDTSYVAAFAEKELYFADENPLNLLGINYKERMSGLIRLDKLSFDKDMVDYIYYRKEQKDNMVFSVPNGFHQVFKNDQAVIYSKK